MEVLHRRGSGEGHEVDPPLPEKLPELVPVSGCRNGPVRLHHVDLGAPSPESVGQGSPGDRRPGKEDTLAPELGLLVEGLDHGLGHELVGDHPGVKPDLLEGASRGGADGADPGKIPSLHRLRRHAFFLQGPTEGLHPVHRREDEPIVRAHLGRRLPEGSRVGGRYDLDGGKEHHLGSLLLQGLHEVGGLRLGAGDDDHAPLQGPPAQGDAAPRFRTWSIHFTGFGHELPTSNRCRFHPHGRPGAAPAGPRSAPIAKAPTAQEYRGSFETSNPGPAEGRPGSAPAVSRSCARPGAGPCGSCSP